MELIAKTILKLSISETEFLNEAPYTKSQLICCVFLNDENKESFSLSNKAYKATIPITKGSDKIGIILRKKESKEIIGCISFRTDMFLPIQEKSVSQWVTLFDSPEDDEFDGDIGVDDDEAPRILITFSFEPDTLMSTPEDSKLIGSLPLENKEVFHPNGFPVSQSSVSNVQSLSINDEENFEGHQKELECEKINYREEKITVQETRQKTPSKSPIKESSSRSPNKRKSPAFQESNQNDFIQSSSQKNFIDNGLENKILDLINILNKNKPEAHNDILLSQHSQSSSNNKNEIEKDYLFQLEKEKNKILEATLNQAETQLSKSENLYRELEKRFTISLRKYKEYRSQEQFKDFIENSKNLNKENYDLKRRIAELEAQKGFYQEGNISSRSRGDFETKILKLEKWNNMLQEQLDKNKLLLQEERDLNITLQADFTKILTQNNDQKKKMMNSQHEQMSQELKELTKLKNQLEKANSAYKSEIEKLELKCQSFETDLEISQQETKRLAQEVEEYKNLGSSFRQVVDELTKQKDKEITSLKEQVEVLNEKLNDIREENEILKNSKDQLEQYVNFVRSMEYEKRIQHLEGNITQLEAEKRKLQEQLLNGRSENMSPSPVKNGTGNMNSIQLQQCDQLRYEINNLKLKLVEMEEIKDKNQLLAQKLKVIQEENDILRENYAITQKRLFATATELVKQTSITIEQNNIITSLNQQMQILDESLKTAFDNIGKLQTSVQTHRRTTDFSQSRNQSFQEVIKKNDIDFMLNEFMSQSVIPNKFTRIGEGVYIFGSKKLNLRIVNDRLVVQMNGGSLYFEEFIRLYAHQELLKIKTGKANTIYSSMEDEEIPHEAKSSQIIWDVDHERPKHQAKRARTDTSRMCSIDTGVISRSAKKESIQTGSLFMSESSQQESSEQDIFIYDITPQNGRDREIIQNGLKRNPRNKPTEKSVDPYVLFTNNLRNYDNEARRTSTRSHDPYKGSSSKIQMKK